MLFRAAERLARGKFFFRAPISKKFSETFFRTSTLQLFASAFTSIFHNKFGYFAQKKQISCPLRENIWPKKMTGAQQKFSRGPQNLGARGNLPPLPPPSRRPCYYCPVKYIWSNNWNVRYFHRLFIVLKIPLFSMPSFIVLTQIYFIISQSQSQRISTWVILDNYQA
jgi:hypothetical protein